MRLTSRGSVGRFEDMPMTGLYFNHAASADLFFSLPEAIEKRKPGAASESH